jgi:hypothetical protein
VKYDSVWISGRAPFGPRPVTRRLRGRPERQRFLNTTTYYLRGRVVDVERRFTTYEVCSVCGANGIWRDHYCGRQTRWNRPCSRRTDALHTGCYAHREPDGTRLSITRRTLNDYGLRVPAGLP